MTSTPDNGRPCFTLSALSSILFDQFTVPSNATIYVGLSGGLDSVVLLHAMSSLKRDTHIQLLALHADHGIHADSQQWSRFCQELCGQWSIPLRIRRLNVSIDKAIGYEASARRARYGWFKSVLEAESYLLLAHHLDDQAETQLLNLFRGAGIRGMSAMAEQSRLGAGTLLRPLLRFERRVLEEYAQERSLRWVTDVTNEDLSLSRNYLRHQVLPMIRSHWPSVDRVLARNAAHMRETQQLLDQIATQDLVRMNIEPVPPLMGEGVRMRIARLGDLSELRLKNALRHCFIAHGFESPRERHLAQVIDTLVARQPRSTTLVRWRNVEIRRFDDWLYALRTARLSAPDDERVWDLEQPLWVPELRIKLIPTRSTGEGIARARLTLPVQVRWRKGGERCRLVARRHHHRLKKLLQEHRVPPWIRDRIPMLCVGNDVVAVAGYWYCEPFVAKPGEPGWTIHIVAAGEPASN